MPVNKAAVKRRLSDSPAEPVGTLQGYFSSKKYDIDIYARECLVTGREISGPAIVTELTSTTIVPPGWELTVDEADSMVMRRGNGGTEDGR